MIKFESIDNILHIKAEQLKRLTSKILLGLCINKNGRVNMKVFSKFLMFSFLFCLFFITSYAQPAGITNLKVSQSQWGHFTYVSLSWNDITMNPVRHFYNIYKKEGAIEDSGKFRKTYRHIPFTSWKDKFVRLGHTYSYYVTAVYPSGESAPSDTVEITIGDTVKKAIITGTLKDALNNEPIVKGRVNIMPIFGWKMTNVQTDSLGKFKASVYPGKYILFARGRGYLPEFYENAKFIFHAQKIIVQSGDSLDFTINLNPIKKPKRVMLSGTVLDSFGNPIRAAIKVYSLNANTYYVKSRKTFTDSSGKYSIPVIEGDTVVVYARSLNRQFYPEFYNGKSTFLEADRIPITQAMSNINFVLEHKKAFDNRINGVVINSDSIGVESIILAYRYGIPQHHRKIYSTGSDSLGNYSLNHLFPGKYILLAVPRDNYKPTYFRYDGTQTMNWREADSVIVDSAGIVSGINFNVIALSDSGANIISGLIKDNSGNPVNGALVYAKDDNGEIYSYGVTNNNGSYVITGLIPGKYDVSSAKFGYTTSQSSSVTLDYNSNYSSSVGFNLTPDETTNIESTRTDLPNDYLLNQNYPNPFNPTTTISYQIPQNSHVILKVYNILGKEVATLVNGQEAAGKYQINFNASNLASGIYLYQLRAGSFIATKKLILLK